MSTPHTIDSVRRNIHALQLQQQEDGMMLREAVVDVVQSIKPINLLKSTIKGALESTELRGGLVSAVLGVTAGYFSRKFFLGSSPGPVRKLLGTLLMFGVSKLITKNSGLITKVEDGLIQLVSQKESVLVEEETYNIS